MDGSHRAQSNGPDRHAARRQRDGAEGRHCRRSCDRQLHCPMRYRASWFPPCLFFVLYNAPDLPHGQDWLDYAVMLEIVNGFVDLLERIGLDEFVERQPSVAKEADHSRDEELRVAS